MTAKLITDKRILVANRGEIAIRIFRAATELNMQTVAIYSDEDRFSVHRFKADEAYRIGEKGDPLGAYLNWQEILEIAKEKQIDFIHPGYGFLSENAEFARACEKTGITFCGPSSSTLELFGDKLKAKQTAIAAGISVIPGTEAPVETLEEAREICASIGYPVTLKALSGGGGKGIRIVETEGELFEAFERAKSEAKSSFGQADIYIEKNIQRAKHIEVQIAGDPTGNIVHLFERDCSVQRRHQKVVEIAPALGIPEATRSQLLADAIKIAKSVSYVGIGTVEFLVAPDGKHYFLEVNPRIQVEHTVTEMTTGIDLAQTSIILAAGRGLDHSAINIRSQDDIKLQGVAIQCRITTENPLNNFAPDTGVILAYRPAQGFGIRLDEGFATSGGIVTPFYDSLLVKVTAHSFDLYGAQQKMKRALKEFRIRGVKHNIPLLLNIISHPKFTQHTIDTKFLDEHNEVFEIKQPRDRATKLLNYIADTTINNPHNIDKHEVPKQTADYNLPAIATAQKGQTNAKSILDTKGVDALKVWILNESQLLLTDTTMRDAHQSLFATRLRNFDIYKATQFYNDALKEFFSLEVWGGATFDTCLRFLKEDPWERLSQLREKIPDVMLQMLIRGDNAVGYTNYPKWVVKDFIRLTAEAGLDVFRIFDCLNNPEQMTTAIEEVKRHGKIAEACICYTGNLLNKNEVKYNLEYYCKLAKKLETLGADILCIKDMAGLLRPKAAEILVSELKNRINLPIHLHTHATAGSSEATLLSAANAGCDIVDGAVSSMSGLTSQPSLNATIAALEGSSRQSQINLDHLNEISRYWEAIRPRYNAFDPGVRSTSTDVYNHEIPGGQYSNLYDQAKRVGLSANEFFELTKRYQEVNQLFGNIVKVTPSSKVVGDMALLLQKMKLDGNQLIQQQPHLDYPDSVVSFFKGHMGIPYGGFEPEIRELVLGENPPEPQLPSSDENDNIETARKELKDIIQAEPSDHDVISYRLYPKVWLDYHKHTTTYGKVEGLPTHVFFYGLPQNQEIEVELESGKTLIISLSGMTEPDDNGIRRVFFQLNGFPRALEVIDKNVIHTKTVKPKADLMDKTQIAAPMPGKVLDVKFKLGDEITKGDTVIVTESMKMEYAIKAKESGKVAEIFVSKDDYIEEGDLMMKIDINDN